VAVDAVKVRARGAAEVVLTAAAVGIAAVPIGWLFLSAAHLLDTSMSQGHRALAALATILVAAFPVSAWLGARYVHHHAHGPIDKRLYVLGTTGALLLWTCLLLLLWGAVEGVLVLSGHASFA
jgi:hypothetical protein